MPLLNIVGITCTNQTFNAGFAFIQAENEEKFTWVAGNLLKLSIQSLFARIET